MDNTFSLFGSINLDYQKFYTIEKIAYIVGKYDFVYGISTLGGHSFNSPYPLFLTSPKYSYLRSIYPVSFHLYPHWGWHCVQKLWHSLGPFTYVTG